MNSLKTLTLLAATPLTFWSTDKIVLRIYGAREVSARNALDPLGRLG